MEAQSCTGDCDADQTVSVAELVNGVNIALGTSEVDRCTAFDRNGSGTVSVDELVEAVRNALEGCSAGGTQTPRDTPEKTPTVSPAQTPTPSVTPPSLFEVAIRGIVLGASGAGGDVVPLGEATVRGTVDRNGDGRITDAEAVTSSADGEGSYELRVSVASGQNLIVGFHADGFAPLFRAVLVEAETELVLNITLQATTILTCTGQRCSLDSEALSIEGLPEDVTGAARVFNPVTETDSFPGDFSDSDGNLLVSGVFAAVELEDVAGQPVKELAGEATLRMRIPRDTWAVIRDVEPHNGQIDVPLYAFDEVLGTWVREGEAVLEDGHGMVLAEEILPQIQSGVLGGVVVARGAVAHFSYWNVDWPVDSHACINGVVADAGGSPVAGATILVRGVTYAGSSDAIGVAQDGSFCVEVMRSEAPGEDVDQDGVLGETQRIRVRVSHEGKLYDFGEYDVPVAQGTCGGGACADIGTLRLTPERELRADLCVVTGTVRRVDGSPAEGAVVFGSDETVPDELYDTLCEQAEAGYCDALGFADESGAFQLTTVVLDSLYYAAIDSVDEATSSLFMSSEGSVQGCPSTPLNINLNDVLRFVDVTVEVSGNVISWVPPGFQAGLLNVSSSQDTKWALYSESGGFPPPVTYGVLPPGTVQIAPFGGGGPAPLESGDQIDIFVGGVGDDGYPYWGYSSGLVP